MAHVRNESSHEPNEQPKKPSLGSGDEVLTPAHKQMEALFDEETTFESVNERISSEILEEIMSQDVAAMAGDASSTKLGSHVRKLEQRMRQKVNAITASLRQVHGMECFGDFFLSEVYRNREEGCKK